MLDLVHVRTGHRAAINEAPAHDGRGNIAVDLETSTYWVLTERQRRPLSLEQRAGQLHLNHFVTCAHSADWRQRMRARKVSPLGAGS